MAKFRVWPPLVMVTQPPLPVPRFGEPGVALAFSFGTVPKVSVEVLPQPGLGIATLHPPVPPTPLPAAPPLPDRPPPAEPAAPPEPVVPPEEPVTPPEPVVPPEEPVTPPEEPPTPPEPVLPPVLVA